jgi:biotin carboxyl carrier protein
MPLTQNERQGILLAAAARAAQQPNGAMRLRISFEGRSYEVEVEVLSATCPTPDSEPDEAIPGSVLVPHVELDLRDEDRVCRSPIAGAIVSVPAEAGCWLRKDDPVVVIEAMKMQTNIGAPVDGVVEEVNVTKGDAVKPGQVLCRQAARPLARTMAFG